MQVTEKPMPKVFSTALPPAPLPFNKWAEHIRKEAEKNYFIKIKKDR